MSLPSLGPPLEIPHNGAKPTTGETTRLVPFPIDLGAHQRAIMADLERDQGRLAQLDQERVALIARIHAGRGKLDLIAELAQPVMTSGE